MLRHKMEEHCRIIYPKDELKPIGLIAHNGGGVSIIGAANSLVEGTLLSLLLLAIALALPVGSYLSNTSNPRYLTLSLAALAAGIYVAAASELGALLFGQSISWQYVAFVALLFLPVGVSSFVLSIIPTAGPSLYLQYLEKCSQAFAVLSSISLAANIITVAAAIKIFIAFTAVTFSVITGILVKSLSTGNRPAEKAVLGLIAFLILSLVALICQTLGIFLPTGFPLVWALTILLISFLAAIRLSGAEKREPQRLTGSHTARDGGRQDRPGQEWKTSVAAFAHEINTPLGIGLLNASSLANEVDELYRLFRTDELKKSDLERHLLSYKEAAAAIETNLQNASELVRTFKHDSLSTSQLSREAFSVDKCLKRVVDSLQSKISQAGHRMVYSCNADIAINSYPVMLSQIVTNLIMNSLTHAYQPGVQGCLKLEVKADGDCLVMLYSDDGKGIEKSILHKVFEPYFTTRPGANNTGLGLFIIYSIVTHRLGGTVECQSTPGHGTHFTIKIPIERSSPNGDTGRYFVETR